MYNGYTLKERPSILYLSNHRVDSALCCQMYYFSALIKPCLFPVFFAAKFSAAM